VSTKLGKDHPVLTGPIVGWGLKKESYNEIRFIFHKCSTGGLCNWEYFGRNVFEDRKYFDKIYEDEISVFYLAKYKQS